VKNNNNEYVIYFCGISKNCHKNIEKNLKFLDTFSKDFRYSTKVVVVDSDSNDGTKDIIKKYKNKNNFIINELDGLEDIYSNRIKRIAVSRNKCLEIIAKMNNKNKIIYIPLDLDLDLFKFVSIEKLNHLIDYSINKNIPYGIFPFSTPYYYDIFALRADNWVEYNSQLRIKKLKNIFFIGSFFLNYLYIFRHQLDLQKFKKFKSNVSSAFGGMGIYNLNSSVIKNYYKLSKKNPEFVSEHVLFNMNFDLEIIEDWNIPAPPEHLEFKLLDVRNKIIYFLKTFYFDLVNKK
tara:strand:+ start:2311 stop:3183 length:873 start_codon:yes stop_codon:yes gene_type:complete